MATTVLGGNEVQTVGELPAVGSTAPSFTLTGSDFADFSDADFAGQRLVINIFPTIDTGVCKAGVRHFNEAAAALDNTTVLCVSADLPLSTANFCGAEGLDRVKTGSTLRSGFGDDYGVRMTTGKWTGLMARSVVVVDEARKVLYTELVPDIGKEPDYDAAIAALG
jgi:thiol peroxidase